MNGALVQVEADVAELATSPLWSLSDGEITDEVRRTFALMQRLSGRFVALIGAAEGREVPCNAGATGTANWLTFLLAMRHRDAQAWAALARSLPGVPVAEEALADGRVNVEQARVIAKTVNDLPSAVGELGRAKAADVLTKLAVDEHLRPEVLEKHRSQILELVAPEIAEERLRRDLERAERSAYDRRDFTLIPHGEGEYRVRGVLDAEAAAIVRAALDPLSGPCKPAPDADGTPAEADLRSAGARRADALTEVCQRVMNCGELPDNGGEKPHLTITLPWEQLKAAVGAGLLDTGDLLTPETVRRLACDAMIIPAILGGDGQVLDVGRARRLIDGPLRRALVLRDKGCAFPGCDRPPQWCHGHHVTGWADGGDTCLANSVLLCGFHHREIHHGHWEVRIRTDGFPEFIPPSFVDPQRRPVQNTLYPRC